MLKQKAYIMVGPPGAGKGTQGELLVKKFKLKVIQPGAILRREAEKETDVGLLVNGIISQGLMVPNDFIDKKIFTALRHNTKSILFDGYPRTEGQAEKLADYLKKNKIPAYLIVITLTEKLIIERISGRRSCACGETYHIKYNKPRKFGICDKCGQKLYIRNDSRLSVIQQRIKVYHDQTEPVIKYFKKRNDVKLKMIKINGNQAIEKIHADIIKAIKK